MGRPIREPDGFQEVEGLSVTGSENGVSELPADVRRRSRDLVGPTDEVVYGVDLEGRCVFASASAGRVLGYEVEELLGEDVHRLIHHARADGSPYPKEECPVHRTLQTGLGYRVADEVYWRKDGGLLPAECSSHPVFEGGELRGAVVVLVDANERGRIEAARRTGEERYRALTEAATDGILVSEEDGTISSANDAAGRIFGYDADELVGKRLVELMPERFRPAYEAAFARYLETGERAHPWRSVRSYGLRGDGEEVPVEISYGELFIGGVRSFIGFYRDVTEWEETEEQARFQAQLLDQVRAAIIATDLEGRVTHWNEYAGELYGWSREEAIGRNITDLTVGPGRVGAAEGIMARMWTGKHWEGEFEVKRKDGSSFPAHVSNALFYDADGREAGIVGVSTDATGRRRSEEAVHEMLRYARRYASQLRGLAGAALTVNSARSVDEMLEAITAQARELIGVPRAVTSLAADDGSGEAITAVSRADGEGDVGGSARVAREEVEVVGGASGLSAPLTGRDGGDLGLIRLSGKDEGGFDEVDQTVLSHLAQIASVALENARLYQQARSTIDSLSAQISILDETGTVVAVNRAWREFAAANGGTDGAVNEGVSYLDVCDASAALGSADAAAIAEGIRAVMSGRQESFEMEYPCPSPDRKRWFVARVTRFPDLEPPRLAVAHEDVTEHKRASESMLEIREAERRRLARDLHDVVLQDIAGAVQGLQAAQIERGDEDSGPDLSMELEALRRSVGNLRDAIYDLRSEKEFRFVRAVESLVELNRQALPERKLRLEVEEGFPSQLPDIIGQELLRVVQEALINVRRHSEAWHVTVVLGVDRGRVRAEISDDGRGFDPGGIKDGFGLSGMRERVTALGGELNVQSSPGAGTRVEVRVPI